MMFWLYAKHHWPPSAYIKMPINERRVMQAFYMKEQEEIEAARRKIENEAQGGGK